MKKEKKRKLGILNVHKHLRKSSSLSLDNYFLKNLSLFGKTLEANPMCVVCIECDGLIKLCDHSDLCDETGTYIEVVCQNCHNRDQDEYEEEVAQDLGLYDN